MQKIKLIISIVFFFIFLPAKAQIALDDADIEKYLSTLPKLQLLIMSQEPESDSLVPGIQYAQEDNLTSRTPISDNLQRMKNHPTFDRFSSIVQEAGFDNPSQWAVVGDEIMLAYSAYLIHNPPNRDAPTLEEIKKDLGEQLNKIKRNQFITPEHKQLLVNKIQNSIAMLNDPTYIANENISAIRPYIGRLTSYLRNTNDTY